MFCMESWSTTWLSMNVLAQVSRPPATSSTSASASPVQEMSLSNAERMVRLPRPAGIPLLVLASLTTLEIPENPRQGLKNAVRGTLVLSRPRLRNAASAAAPRSCRRWMVRRRSGVHQLRGLGGGSRDGVLRLRTLGVPHAQGEQQDQDRGA